MVFENRKEYIVQLANVIRNNFKIQTPVKENDFRLIVETLNGDLYYGDNLDYEAKIERNNEKFIISVDSSKPENRQRFSLAHELGHLFLHMKRLDEKYWSNNVIKDSAYFRYGRGIEELEANEFAGAFLMPEEEFLDLYHNDYGITDIARRFNVSEPAVYTRGKNLNLW
ncbi:ImmA/IrrE family metallo-endopeptidase [Paraclostridium bifermentans]|uniref:ImmA/IrrE family metallo-endopeptidase n=1 Tax=Paraclostridium bifermentans TaxID=1490 RepID=UPI001C7ED559|nr:ImmA/IrrE family metallo-endopeptidase [Paraclostridium bifermentans]GIM31527.1 hypothetical protein PAGU1678_07970 [Paraclostridium bifermentans subsp. muricolitidis]